jgi:hypothetical protein
MCLGHLSTILLNRIGETDKPFVAADQSAGSLPFSMF